MYENVPSAFVKVFMIWLKETEKIASSVTKLSIKKLKRIVLQMHRSYKVKKSRIFTEVRNRSQQETSSNYEGCLLLLMFNSDLLFAIKRDAYIFKETGRFCRFPKHQKFDKWAMAEEKRQTCWPKLHIETEYDSQLTIRWNRNINKYWRQEKKK